eukprot:796804-Alexandrium_andersonii.AAC.1
MPIQVCAHTYTHRQLSCRYKCAHTNTPKDRGLRHANTVWTRTASMIHCGCEPVRFTGTHTPISIGKLVHLFALAPSAQEHVALPRGA